MQAIILAAGMGRRLGHYTEENTKCMIPVGERTLIERMLDSLSLHKLKRIVLVVGYKGENVEAHIGNTWKGIEVVYVYNNIYDKTNNIYSLYLARDYLIDDDTILLESDLIFTDDVLSTLIDDPRESLVLVSPFESWMDGTVIRIGDDGRILEFISGKNLNFRETSTYYKTVNLYKFSSGFSKNRYLPFLEAYIKSAGHNEYYEQVLNVLNFLDDKDLRACVLSEGQTWYEIDDKQDLDNAELLFSESKEKLKRLQEHYGGYWRYPGLVDFCYLVNPYFPSARLMEEMTANFPTLVSEYPSGLDVQNLIASKLFEISRRYILTGNGAAELINVLMNEPGIVTGFIAPTFNEYPNRVLPEDIRYYIPENVNFSYQVDDLLSFSEKLDRLVLINPDNPSGNYIRKDEIIRLLRELKNRNVQLILDESFVDFSEDGEVNTLLDNELLEEFPNLVIVKSISKSYGVPGLRLGILASTDMSLIQRVRKGLSIWNINSFGEFFLQVIGKYKNDYDIACRRIAAERAVLFEALSRQSGIRPIPSQANYITCELTGGMKAEELTVRMLEGYNFFIKDLTGKTGIPEDSEYIRLAVRNAEDNEQLISALEKELK